MFNEALSEDLYGYRARHPEVILLQYVDGLMLAGTTEEAYSHATGDLLQTLGTLVYRASAKKAQISKQEVAYLGYKIRQGQRWLTQAMKAQGPPPDERVSGDCKILQTVDHGVC